QLFRKYQLNGWEEACARLTAQLREYDAWVGETLLPKARTDFRLPPEQYALNLERYGVDIAPAVIAEMAHAAFKQYQNQMAAVAAQVAKQRKLPSSDYREVIAALKKEQITGDAILPFYERRLKDIEAIIVKQRI